MTLFWILAAGLVGLALLFVLPPLLSKRLRTEDLNEDELNLAIFHRQLRELDADLASGALGQQQYEAARLDLERELLHDIRGVGSDEGRDGGGGRWAASLLAIALPVLAVFLYLILGNQQIVPLLATAASNPTPADHPTPGGKMPALEVMIQRLVDKLEQNPEYLEGWMVLGRTYFAIGRPEQALPALKKAYDLGPENPDVLVAYAEALAADNGGELEGRPAELIHAALKNDPQHSGARWLEGLVSFQAGEYLRAAEQWEALAPTFEPGSESAAELKRYIAEARSRVGSASSPESKSAPEQVQKAPERADSGQQALPTADAATPKKPATSAQGATQGVKVEVSLAESLQSRVDAGDSLFVYAKAVSGPPMPLAARRARAGDLPLTLTLDDSTAMMPAMKLSRFDQVTLGARISKSGQAIPQSGDLEGEVSPVEPGQAGAVKILIDRVIP